MVGGQAKSDTMRPQPVTSGPTGVNGTLTDAAGEFHIDVVDRIGSVDPVAWDAAVDAHRLPVFYSRTFLGAYERHPLTGIDGTVYLTVRRRGDGAAVEPPAAVLPAYLQHRADPLRCLTPAYPAAAGRAALLSHVWHCYDTHVGGRHTDPALVTAVMSALRRVAAGLGASWCGLVNVHRDGPTASALASAGLPLRQLVDRFAADTAGLTDLEHFLARSARPRAAANLRRYRRRAAEHGVTSTLVPIGEADIGAVADLCRRSAGKHGSDTYYPAGRFEDFLAEIGPVARVVEIRQRGRLLSAGVCLLDEHRLHCWAGGADYEVDGNFSAYYLMFAGSIELALTLRRPMFEGGRGNADFKLRHGLVARPLVACLVPAGEG